MRVSTMNKPIRFTACEGGYIANDGLRMCKITFEQRVKLEELMSNKQMIAASLLFGSIWRDSVGKNSESFD